MSLAEVFERVSEVLGAGPVNAEFYPYSELKHTWRRVDRETRFRVSDYLDSAPEAVIESLAFYLICRAKHITLPKGADHAYLRYARSRQLWREKGAVYLSRSKSLRLTSKGAVHDLKQVFEYVNSTYFCGKLEEPLLAWSDESPRRRLGFYFGPLNLLVVNSSLDSAKVPRYALEFVMYHELLHHIDSTTCEPMRRIHHDRRFRQQESRFTSRCDAEEWLRKIASAGRRQRTCRGVPRA